MYRAGEVSVYRACYERDTQRHLEGEIGFIKAQHQQVTTRCPRC